MELREEIDGIDRQIAELFVRRMGIAEEVAEYKLSVGKAVFDRERECAKLAALASYGTTPFLANPRAVRADNGGQQKAPVPADYGARRLC